ncbi:MAG: hypothetical protein ACR2FO_08285 [Actinomycetota bacterium]
MTGFTMGMSAAGLWLAVIVGVSQFMRHSTGPPLKTIRRFHLTRQSLKQLPEAGPSRVDSPSESATAFEGSKTTAFEGSKEGRAGKRSRRKRKEVALELPLKARPEPPAELAAPEANVDNSSSGAPDSMTDLFRQPASAPVLAPPNGVVRPAPLETDGRSNDPWTDAPNQMESAPAPIPPQGEINALVNSISEVPAPQDSTLESRIPIDGEDPAGLEPAGQPHSQSVEPEEPQPKINLPGKGRDQFARKAGKLTYFLVDDEGRLVRGKTS